MKTRNFNKLVLFDGSRRLPVPVGTLIENDFNPANWTYTGPGNAVFGASSVTLSGGTSDKDDNLLQYTAMPTALSSGVVTARFTMTGGVVGVGLKSRRAPTVISDFVILNTGAGPTQGNVLLFIANTFDQETDPVLLPYTSGDSYELQITYSLLSFTVSARNVTQGSSTLSLTKTRSIVYPSVSELLPVCDLTVYNYNGTNVMTAFSYRSNEWMYADSLWFGTSKVEYYYSDTQAQGASNVWATAKNKKVVNCGAQSDDFSQFILLIALFQRMKPQVLYFADTLRNNISRGTFNATCQSQFQQMRVAAAGWGGVCWFNLALPEATLDQSAGDAYINANCPANRITQVPPGWNQAVDTADGTHPNVLGNGKWGNNVATYGM